MRWILTNGPNLIKNNYLTLHFWVWYTLKWWIPDDLTPPLVGTIASPEDCIQIYVYMRVYIFCINHLISTMYMNTFLDGNYFKIFGLHFVWYIVKKICADRLLSPSRIKRDSSPFSAHDKRKETPTISATPGGVIIEKGGWRNWNTSPHVRWIVIIFF